MRLVTLGTVCAMDRRVNTQVSHLVVKDFGYLIDFDGVCSDLKIYVMLATDAGLPDASTSAVRDYITDRTGWHHRVAMFYCDAAGLELNPVELNGLCAGIKRWPNALGNGSSHRKLLEMSELPPGCPQEQDHVSPLMAELRKLKRDFLAAPCNANFVKRHRERLLGASIGMSAYAVDTKVFSLLVATREHAILMAPTCLSADRMMPDAGSAQCASACR